MVVFSINHKHFVHRNLNCGPPILSANLHLRVYLWAYNIVLEMATSLSKGLFPSMQTCRNLMQKAVSHRQISVQLQHAFEFSYVGQNDAQFKSLQ